MKRKHVCVGLGLLLLICWGCQTAQQTPREKDKQANAYIEKAQTYESQGNLLEALEQFKLAQTIDPADAVITQGIQRLEKRLHELAEAHYRAGLRFRDKGKWDLAKKEFLKALRYNPDDERAAAMLQQRRPKESRRYITHQIAPGDSVSKLALKYYGDYKKYHHIANFNNMSDATQIRVGQRILIPVIDGVTLDDLVRISGGTTATTAPPPAITGEYSLHKIQPGESLSKVAQKYYGDFKLFRVIADYNGIADPTSVKVGQTVKVPRLEDVAPPAAAGPDSQTPYTPELDEPETIAETPEAIPEAGDVNQPEETEVMDQVAGYRETGIALFNEGKYDEAIIELQKVLNATPDDPKAIQYISRSYVEMGKTDLAANRIKKARTAFTTALDYDATCANCQDLLAKCRTMEADALTAEGERQLRDNQFDQAISTLERAIELDPDNPSATDLLFQTHYKKSLILYNKQDYLASMNGFEKAVAIKPDCSDCKQYIEKSMDAYKEFHYNQGIVFFGQQKLKPAITSWEQVVAVDPDYKDVQTNLKKAKQLSERLERIKKSSAE